MTNCSEHVRQETPLTELLIPANVHTHSPRIEPSRSPCKTVNRQSESRHAPVHCILQLQNDSNYT